MRREIYFISLIFFIFIGLLILTLYHFQDFSSEIIFEESFNFTSDHTDNYINWIESPIGRVNLSNNGIFTHHFILPKFIGCLNLKQNSTLKLPIYEFEIYMRGTKDNSVEIAIGQELEYLLIAKYSPKSSKLSFKQLEENIVGFSIYEIKSLEENPLRNSYEMSQNNQYYCQKLLIENTPIKFIKLDI